MDFVKSKIKALANAVCEALMPVSETSVFFLSPHMVEGARHVSLVMLLTSFHLHAFITPQSPYLLIPVFCTVNFSI